METLSEHTLSGLTDKEIKQLAKRCPIVMTVTEDVLLQRFEYVEELETSKPEVIADMRLDLEDAQVSIIILRKLKPSLS